MDSTDPNDSINQTLAEYRMEEVVNGAKYFMNITNADAITFVFTEANYKLANKLKKTVILTAITKIIVRQDPIGLKPSF